MTETLQIEQLNQLIIDKIQEKITADKEHVFLWEIMILFNENSFRALDNEFIAPEWYDLENITTEQLDIWCEHFMYHIADEFIEQSPLDLKKYNDVLTYLTNYDGEKNGFNKFVKSYLETTHSEVK
jgi:hypothetical protein